MTTPDHLDPRQLEAFVAVISIGSMTGAARSLGCSQPAVTRMVQDLEQQLGFPLLHRKGPRFTPTEQGIAFYEQAEMFLAGLRGISERAQAIATRAPQPIRIAALHSLASSVVPAALVRVEPSDLPASIHLRTASAENIVQSVAAGAADIGLVTLPMDHDGVELHWVAEVPCVALLSWDHPLAGQPEIRPEDFARYRLITTHNPYRLRQAIDEALADAGVTPLGIIDNNATAVSMALARQRLGIAIVESMTIRGLPTQGLVERRLSVPLPYRWGVITAVGRPVPPLVDQLIGLVRRTATDMIEGLAIRSAKE